jgi:hypothetical protein
MEKGKVWNLERLKKEIGEAGWQKLRSRSRPDIPKYQIDRKLKSGRHYPVELDFIFDILSKVLPTVTIDYEEEKRRKDGHFIYSERNREAVRGQFKELTLLERSFREYFINPFSKEKSVSRINKRLLSLHPQLGPKGPEGAWGFSLNQVSSSKTNIDVWWHSLAKVIEGLDSKLVHQCEACGNVFISKQTKKYHSECRGPYLSKIFSERYVKSGRAASKQKAYRERKKTIQVK